jgi:hypothetical protein
MRATASGRRATVSGAARGLVDDLVERRLDVKAARARGRAGSAERQRTTRWRRLKSW